MTGSKRVGTKWLAVLSLVVAAAAQAQTGTGHWTAQSGETVGSGANVAQAQIGFPGLQLDLIHGLDSVTDVRGTVGLNYGFEGLTNDTRFEFTAQVGIRRQLWDNGRFKLAGRFDPGILVGTDPGQFGIKIPVGLELGIPIDNKLTVGATFDVPMYAVFGDFSTFAIPLLFGGGIEYLLEPNVALTARAKVGPTFFTSGGSSFTLYALFGVAYKF